MKKRHVLLIAVAVAGTAFNSPKNVEAAATKLTDNTGLYTIDFEFQAGTEAYRIPVGAMAGLTYGDDSNYLGYRIGDDKKRASGEVAAVVARRYSGQYHGARRPELPGSGGTGLPHL